ncbi:kelch domain-containing protein 3 isoform X1 [Hetaerina americana]|uniref:kelch domain-containing protein 3 isoform X1 n=1 Tax=Hetaerina americana TaxID=62018 RepID=UPI003A7F1C24
MYWTVHLEGGPRRVNHAAVAVGDHIYSFGGYCTGENYRRQRPMDVHVLNTVNYRWTAVPLVKPDDPQSCCVPYQRYGHTAVSYGDKIYIWGGRNDEAACNVLFCFHTKTLKWSCPKVHGIIPGARDGHSACVIRHSMYIFGGFEEEIDRFSQDVHALDLETMEWRYVVTKGTPPSYRDFHSASAVGTKMYIFGGRGDVYGPYHSQEEVYSNEIVYLETLTSTWHCPSTEGEIPLGRRSHSAFVYKNHLYIFGGYNGIEDKHFNDLYCFVPAANHWMQVKTRGKRPCKRRRQSCCVVGDRVFLFGGTSPYLGPQPQFTPDNEEMLMDGLDSKLMDHNDLHVLDLVPTLRTLCLQVVLDENLDDNWLPEDIRWELRAMTTNNNISRPLNNTG